MIGMTLGSYSLQRELGRGGMGAVYVGTHALLGRTAAIKVLLPEFSKNQDMVQRFFNEARAATAIKHPGIVEIYDFGYSPDGSAFIVMEFLQGEPLSARLKRTRLTPAFAVAVTRQIATALAVAHNAGIVHRDLKPDNVFLVPDAEIGIGERIKLLDFGIAKLGDTGAGLQKTSTGAIMGTPYYMSPEQCRGAGHVGPPSDLYAIGVILYEMLCGRVPFVADGAGDIIAAHLLLPPTPLRVVAPDVPVEVEALVMRLLAKQPHDRPATAEALAQELAALGQALGLATSIPPTASPGAPTIAAPSTPPPSSHAAMATVAQPALARQPQRSTTLGGASGQELAMPPSQPRRTGLLAGLAVLVLAGAGAGVFVMTRSSKPATATTDDDPGPVQPRPLTPVEDLHLIAARTAIETQMWTEAVIEAQAALKNDPASEEAKQLAELARHEGAAQVASNAMREAIMDVDLVTANARFAAIPEDSLYKAPAMNDLIAAREHLVVAQTDDVKALIAAGQCKEAKAMVAELQTAAGTGPVEPLVKAAARCKPRKSSGGATAGDAAGDGKADLTPTPIVPEDPSDERARFTAAVAAFQAGDCAATLRHLQGLRNPKAARLREKCKP